MKKPTLQELARRIAALEADAFEPAPLDYTNNCTNCDRGWLHCLRKAPYKPPERFFCSEHSALREEEDHSPSEPSWRFCGAPLRVAWSKHGWRVEFWASLDNKWVSHSYGVCATPFPTRDLAQAALNEYGKAHDWRDLRKPHVRRWKRDDSVLYAKQIDLGDGREHWVAVAQTGKCIALTSLVPGSFSSQAEVEERLGESADFSGWPEMEQ
jgi:hypothetical protein